MQKSRVVNKTQLKISFGIIVLNGLPFLRYCLDALYPHAHEIIVAEGAAERGKSQARGDGHSADGTLEELRRYQAESDPDGKVIVATTEGYWADRDAQSRGYAEKATGDFLWQIDIDEFYQPQDIEAVRAMLAADPSITGASFRWLNFWGGPSTVVDGWFLRAGGGDVNRLFKWGPGYRYGNHWEGPRSFDPEGNDMTQGNWISAETMARKGIRCFHYSLVFPGQVFGKSICYAAGTDPEPLKAEDPTDPKLRPNQWARDVWCDLQNPFRVHNCDDHPAWLEPFSGAHPPAAAQMFADIASGKVRAETRDNADVRWLLDAPWYRLKRFAVKHLMAVRNLPDRAPFSRLKILAELWIDEGFGGIARRALHRFIPRANPAQSERLS